MSVVNNKFFDYPAKYYIGVKTTDLFYFYLQCPILFSCL